MNEFTMQEQVKILVRAVQTQYGLEHHDDLGSLLHTLREQGLVTTDELQQINHHIKGA
ncbi:hypothetical protein ACFOLK_17290 [Marinococcus halophilus]|uniref:Uncharacterized protein n=1 Tax=Marinococcus halophilus TaxID=1371 RepID=A0A510YAA6_MARHA|nr:hypothetical protein [Marinococcus halophilus]GEK60322.1 hypothetical protein MHA01_32270 [Marinococcus halophilus]